EFDQTGKYVREIGQGLYAFVFGHGVSVERKESVWGIDEGANMIIKFDAEGRVLMALGRKPVAGTVPAASGVAEGGWGGGGGGSRKQTHSGIRQRRKLQNAVHERRRSLRNLHHAWPAAISLHVEFKSEHIHG